MNLENVNKAIAVMERVKARGDKIDMRDWMDSWLMTNHPTEEELHTCGTAACFAGWVAVSKEWADEGGFASKAGCPEMAGVSGIRAVSRWLEIPEKECGHLCGTYNHSTFAHSRVYPDSDGCIENIDVDDVLDALYRLKNTGTVYIQEPAQ